MNQKLRHLEAYQDEQRLLVTMLRLQPTTIMLTGDDIALAMDHMQSLKANAPETTPSFTSLQRELQQQEKLVVQPSRIHKQLQTLLVNKEDYARIQKHAGSVIYDDLDGSFEELSIRGRGSSSNHTESHNDSLNVLQALPVPVGPSTVRRGESEVRRSTGGEGDQPYNVQHLDGVSMSLSADDWYDTRSNSPGVADEIEYQSEGISNASTPVLSPATSILSAPSSRGPRTPSPRLPRVSLRGGAAPTDTSSSEYYITSTCPEFVGPTEAFSLMSLYSDPSSLPTMAHSSTPLPIANDFVLSNNNYESDHRSPTPPDPLPNFYRRGLGTYNHTRNFEHNGSVFSPFTYSPEEPVLDDEDDENLTPSLPSTEWDDDDSRGQEGGAVWDLRGPRI